jgi:hypothetical protein
LIAIAAFSRQVSRSVYEDTAYGSRIIDRLASGHENELNTISGAALQSESLPIFPILAKVQDDRQSSKANEASIPRAHITINGRSISFDDRHGIARMAYAATGSWRSLA